MITTLNLSTAAVALVLFATTSALSVSANAAERQISVNPKNFPTFTVNSDKEPVTDESVTAPLEPAAKVTPKAFRVDEKPVVTEEASNEETDVPKKIPRKKEDSFRFRIEDRSQQAASPSSQDDDGDVALAPVKRPATLLNDETNSDDTDHSAEINADQNDENDEAVAETSEEPATQTVAPKKPRVYYYASKQKSYEQAHMNEVSDEPSDTDYQHSAEPTYYDYTGSSCNHSYNGY